MFDALSFRCLFLHTRVRQSASRKREAVSKGKSFNSNVAHRVRIREVHYTNGENCCQDSECGGRGDAEMGRWGDGEMGNHSVLFSVQSTKPTNLIRQES